MHIAVVRSQAGHLPYSPGVTVEIEDDRFAHREQAIDIPVGKPMLLLLRVLHVEQVNPNHSGTFQEGPNCHRKLPFPGESHGFGKRQKLPLAEIHTVANALTKTAAFDAEPVNPCFNQ